MSVDSKQIALGHFFDIEGAFESIIQEYALKMGINPSPLLLLHLLVVPLVVDNILILQNSLRFYTVGYMLMS